MVSVEAVSGGSVGGCVFAVDGPEPWCGLLALLCGLVEAIERAGGLIGPVGRSGGDRQSGRR